jgi:hypothetical protein
MFRHLRLKESWVIFFVLGIIMMNYPFLTIFNKSVTVLNIPLLFLYLQFGWIASIFVIYLFIKAIELGDKDSGQGENN